MVVTAVVEGWKRARINRAALWCNLIEWKVMERTEGRTKERKKGKERLLMRMGRREGRKDCRRCSCAVYRNDSKGPPSFRWGRRFHQPLSSTVLLNTVSTQFQASHLRFSCLICRRISCISFLQVRTTCLTLVFLLSSCQVASSEEREVAGRGEIAAGEGELWVLWTGQDAATAGRHHQSAGQGLHHPAHHQLPEDEGLRQPGGPAVEPAHGRTPAQHLR